MIDYCINNNAVRQTPEAIIKMLKSSQGEDGILLLAYGYFNPDEVARSAIIDWLQKSTSRKILIVVGIHGKLESNDYYTLSRGVNEPPPLKPDDSEVEKVIGGVVSLFKGCTLDESTVCKRIHLYAVAHFHAKMIVLLKEERDAVTDLSNELHFGFCPQEAIVGSANLTTPAFQYNFEFDVHIPRNAKDELGQLASKAYTFLSAALGSRLHDVTDDMRNAVRNRLLKSTKHRSCLHKQMEDAALKQSDQELIEKGNESP